MLVSSGISRYSLNRRIGGFTLVELVISISILAVLAALATPSYRVWMENTRIRTAAESIQAGLQKARVEALRRNLPVQFNLGADSAWTIGCVTATATCPAVIERRVASDGSSSSITATTAPPASTALIFTNLGLVSAVPVPFTQVDVDSSSLSSSEHRPLRIVIGVGGAGRMCDPYTGLATTDPRRC